MIWPQHRTYRKRPRGISSSGPTRTSVETHPFIGHDSKNASAPKCFGVSLSLDFQDIQRQQNDLANANQTSRLRQRMAAPCCSIYPPCSPPSSGMHDGLPRPLSKCIIEFLPMVQCEVISCEGLAPIFVYSLQNLPN